MEASVEVEGSSVVDVSVGVEGSTDLSNIDGCFPPVPREMVDGIDLVDLKKEAHVIEDEDVSAFADLEVNLTYATAGQLSFLVQDKAKNYYDVRKLLASSMPART